jgi:2-polyprenyl-3-methyl-5-hydroxy-6-metoxy-1,4-benzoquinol methylase
MTCCDQCRGLERLFDEKSARRQWKRYIRKGADSATHILVSMVRPLPPSEKSLLDIGGGIGTIQLELLGDTTLGFQRATNVDASSGYQIVAREAAKERDLVDRIDYVFGDFIEVAHSVGLHGVVTLDKVICCYPNMHDLLRHAARRSSSLLAVSYPKDVWWTHVFRWMTSVAMAVIRNPFRMHIHADQDVEKVLSAEGFTQIQRRTTAFWQIRLWRRT